MVAGAVPGTPAGPVVAPGAPSVATGGMPAAPKVPRTAKAPREQPIIVQYEGKGKKIVAGRIRSIDPDDGAVFVNGKRISPHEVTIVSGPKVMDRNEFGQMVEFPPEYEIDMARERWTNAEQKSARAAEEARARQAAAEPVAKPDPAVEQAAQEPVVAAETVQAPPVAAKAPRQTKIPPVDVDGTKYDLEYGPVMDNGHQIVRVVVGGKHVGNIEKGSPKEWGLEGDQALLYSRKEAIKRLVKLAEEPASASEDEPRVFSRDELQAAADDAYLSKAERNNPEMMKLAAHGYAHLAGDFSPVDGKKLSRLRTGTIASIKDYEARAKLAADTPDAEWSRAPQGIMGSDFPFMSKDRLLRWIEEKISSAKGHYEAMKRQAKRAGLSDEEIRPLTEHPPDRAPEPMAAEARAAYLDKIFDIAKEVTPKIASKRKLLSTLEPHGMAPDHDVSIEVLERLKAYRKPRPAPAPKPARAPKPATRPDSTPLSENRRALMGLPNSPKKNALLKLNLEYSRRLEKVGDIAPERARAAQEFKEMAEGAPDDDMQRFKEKIHQAYMEELKAPKKAAKPIPERARPSGLTVLSGEEAKAALAARPVGTRPLGAGPSRGPVSAPKAESPAIRINPMKELSAEIQERISRKKAASAEGHSESARELTGDPGINC